MLAWFNQLIQFLKVRLGEEEGQTMVEYVMLIVLVALAVFILSPSITSAIMNVFFNTSSALQAPPS
jgi:Flp pilus assembly pilin Flp